MSVKGGISAFQSAVPTGAFRAVTGVRRQRVTVGGYVKWKNYTAGTHRRREGGKR